MFLSEIHSVCSDSAWMLWCYPAEKDWFHLNPKIKEMFLDNFVTIFNYGGSIARQLVNASQALTFALEINTLCYKIKLGFSPLI